MLLWLFHESGPQKHDVRKLSPPHSREKRLRRGIQAQQIHGGRHIRTTSDSLPSCQVTDVSASHDSHLVHDNYVSVCITDGTSKGLIKALTPEEMRAVLAHEIGHLKNGDCNVQSIPRVSHASQTSRFSSFFFFFVNSVD
jgi:hypothetical protein